MIKLKRYKLAAFVLACVAALGTMTLNCISNEISNTITVYEGQPLLGEGTNILFTADEGPDSVSAGTSTTYTARLFGIIPLKTVAANVVAPTDLMAGGSAFGVKLLAEGVIVTGFENAENDASPKSDTLRIGDIITAANGEKILSASDLTGILEKGGGAPIKLTVLRGNAEKTVEVTPHVSQSGAYLLGIWVRDSTAGIGTVTFCDPQSLVIAGLGHGICDVDTGVLLPLHSGSLVGAKIHGVVKSKKGDPGELLGSFDENIQLGLLYKNTDVGIFGKMYSAPSDFSLLPVGKQSEVKQGAATILCDVGDGTREYSIEISRIMSTGTTGNKNMLITVTDNALAEKTGGIVQGMSGSPIIQNGKLIGAVTHVLINDPTKGYGIFIENMLNEAYSD